MEVELIHSGSKYKVAATRSGPTSYFLAMNGSFKEMEVHKLTDGGECDLVVSWVRLF